MEEQKVEKVKEKEYDFRNIMLTIIGVFVVLAAVSGGTFAYFAYSATNNTTVSGSAATAPNLTLKVEKVAGGTILVPQLDTYIKRAIVGKDTSNHCIDKNNNTVCQIYKISLENNGQTNFGYSLRMKFNFNEIFTNLKWATTTAASTTATSTTAVTTGTTYSATTSFQNITNNTSNLTLVSGNGSATYYIVIWLSETTSEQSGTDKGTFTGTIELTDPNGNQRLTSTFTSNT